MRGVWMVGVLVVAASIGCGKSTVEANTTSRTSKKSDVVSTQDTINEPAWDALCKLQGQPAGCDLCDDLGWYGDGACDTFCPQPDPDCNASNPEAPYGGVAATIPGTIEAENYDLGGEGVAYHDSDATNTLGAYRSDGVDIKACSDSRGCGDAVGTFGVGEWLQYTVDVTETRAYRFSARVATVSATSFHIEVDGTDLTGSIAVPANETSWDGGWETVAVANISVTTGTHELRVVNDAGYFDLNDFTFDDGETTPPALSPPQQAIAAGYTHVILNTDFASTAATDVIDCADQPQTSPWHQGLDYSYQQQEPCSTQVSTVYDPVFGGNVLDLAWTTAVASTNNQLASISTFPNDSPPSPHFSFKFGYAEAVMRLPTPDHAAMAFWAWGDTWTTQQRTAPYDVTVPDVSEFDVVEAYTDLNGNNPGVNGYDQQVIPWGGSGGPSNWANPADIDLLQPHTFGVLWTPSQICFYIDNVLDGSCAPTTATTTRQEIYLILSVAPFCGWASGGYTPACIGDLQRIDAYVSRVTVWQ